MPSEIRCKGDQYAQKTNIIGTNMFVYTAWEMFPDDEPFIGSKYHTVTHSDAGTPYGKIGSDDPERYTEAFELIKELFPEATDGKPDTVMMEIVRYE